MIFGWRVTPEDIRIGTRMALEDVFLDKTRIQEFEVTETITARTGKFIAKRKGEIQAKMIQEGDVPELVEYDYEPEMATYEVNLRKESLVTTNRFKGTRKEEVISVKELSRKRLS